jgi:hypothetical protein
VRLELRQRDQIGKQMNVGLHRLKHFRLHEHPHHVEPFQGIALRYLYNTRRKLLPCIAKPARNARSGATVLLQIILRIVAT